MSSFFDPFPNAKNIRSASPIDSGGSAVGPDTRVTRLHWGASWSRVALVLLAAGTVSLVLATTVVMTAVAAWHLARAQSVAARPAEPIAAYPVWYAVADKTAAGDSGKTVPISVNLRVLSDARSPVHEVLPFGARARVALAQPADAQWIAVLASDGATVFVRRDLISLVVAYEQGAP